MKKSITFLLVILVALSSIGADAASKKKNKTKFKKSVQTLQPASEIAIGYANTTVAYNALKTRTDVAIKPNAKPFGWQQRSGPWYVVTEQPNIEWAFTEGGHYAHPSVVKRMIDIGSSDHVYVDMAIKCGAVKGDDCDKLLAEFKETNLLIRKVYQKKYIQTADGTPAWGGVDVLD